MSSILEVKNLTVQYRRQKNQPWVSALRNVEFMLEKGESLGIVGESGCGKSTLALTLMGLLPPTESQINSGTIFFEGKDLTRNSLSDWRSLRSKKIAMIFQDPFTSLNPVLTIKYQLKEVLSDEKRLKDLLEKVQLNEPERILSSYPHQLSGGQRQRVMIAMAIAQNPDLLIADEPTTALDVSVQLEIINLLKKLKDELKMSLIFVSHNIGLVKEISEKMAVMYLGEIVEMGHTSQIISSPLHPYTQGLLESIPKLKKQMGGIPTLEGQAPGLNEIPVGCSFHPRCKKVLEKCREISPIQYKKSSQVRCHLYES